MNAESRPRAHYAQPSRYSRSLARAKSSDMLHITLAPQLLDAGFPSHERAKVVEAVLILSDLTDIQVGGQTFVCSPLLRQPFLLT